ncbi:MAG: DUF3015 family protein [Nitrospinaceae bacterium]
MKKYLIGGAILFTLVAFSGTAIAHPAGYGDAGCGPGSLIYGKKRDGAQILAAIADPTGTMHSTAITFGTSNCGADKLTRNQRERENFASINYNSLVKEMAAGKGENLDNLASMYGCSRDTYGDFGTVAQENFSTIVKDQDTSTKDMLGSLEQQISGHTVLSKTCTGVIG